MTDRLIKVLSSVDQGFDIKRGFPFNHEIADVYAFRKGRNFIIPQRDYLFFHDIKNRNINVEIAETLHNAARGFVNKEYRVPKALRLTVPNITSVFYSETGVDDNFINLASKWTRSIIGGEIHQIIVVSFGTKTFYSQGVNKVRASVDGISVNVKFKKIDPQNRVHYLIEQIVSSI
jgi:hypothetical protein